MNFELLQKHEASEKELYWRELRAKVEAVTDALGARVIYAVYAVETRNNE